MIEIQMPRKVQHIISAIEGAGFEAYAVGGCVRDCILGRTPDDWDITTSAKPVQIKELFPRTIDTGIKHGTVTVMLEREGFEITTYRIDGEYEDGRHPKDVQFTLELTEDLRRRDFTVNAMAYSDTKGLIDVFGGLRDINQKIIRCVGSPEERFTEDALRMMRAVRFCAQLGYEMEEKTGEAIGKMAENLRLISAERIHVELCKLLTSSHPELLRQAWSTGMTKIFLPEFDRCMETEQENLHHCLNVGEHILRSIQAVRADAVLRFAMLFHDIGKPLTKETDEKGIDHFYGHAVQSAEIAGMVMKRLKFDNDSIHQVTMLVRFHDDKIGLSAPGVRKAMNRVGRDLFPLLLEVKRADVEAQSEYEREEKRKYLRVLEEIYEKVLEDEDCVTLKELAVTGRDLIAAGMIPGQKIGVVLEDMLQRVLEAPELNTKERLLIILDDMRNKL